MTVVDTLIARNHRAGFRGDRTNPPFGTTDATFSHVTVAENCEEGILAPHEGDTRVEASMLWGNLGPDLVLGPPGTDGVRFNVIGDDELDGVNGNVASDPRFRDPAGGDWRLTFGSPAVDSAPDSAREIDLDHNARGTDGDLDIVRRSDRGALELQPFELVGETRLGAEVELHLAGEPGATSVLFLSGRALKDAVMTPFGEAHRPFWRATLPYAAGPGPEVHPFQMRAPTYLVGRTLSMQALTTSSVAPAGRAYTNPVEFVLEP